MEKYWASWWPLDEGDDGYGLCVGVVICIFGRAYALNDLVVGRVIRLIIEGIGGLMIWLGGH